MTNKTSQPTTAPIAAPIDVFVGVATRSDLPPQTSLEKVPSVIVVTAVRAHQELGSKIFDSGGRLTFALATIALTKVVEFTSKGTGRLKRKNEIDGV